MDSVSSLHLNTSKTSHIFKIVLTGGPCGGKTTASVRLTTFFERLGWKVLKVPEIASLLFSCGFNTSDVSRAPAEFQEKLLKLMMMLEDTVEELARALIPADKKTLILHDRGTMDGCAYIDSNTWKQIISKNQFNEVDLRDKRYNLVIYMETAAINAESFYEKNKVRTEGISEARAIDEKTQKAWLGNPQLKIVNNRDCKTFDSKINKVIQIIADQVGVNIGQRLAPESRKRKFLIASDQMQTANISYQEFDVALNFLKAEEKDVRIRVTKRGKDGNFIFTRTQHRISQSVETRMYISKRQYEAFLKHVDPERREIRLKRRCFVVDEQYFEYDMYEEPTSLKGFKILETYSTKAMDEKVDLPTFMLEKKEITHDKNYSLFTLSSPEARSTL